MNHPVSVVKRNGELAQFSPQKIHSALSKCYATVGRPVPDHATPMVVSLISGRFDEPTVEQVQDAVETVLLSLGEREAAKRYMAYRDERAEARRMHQITPEIRAAFGESAQVMGHDPLRTFQYFDKYARWNGVRRETWPESTDRSVEFLRYLVIKNCGADLLTPEEWAMLSDGIRRMDSLPSMRLLAMAGPAAERDNIAIYNCSYQVIDSIESFRDSLLISMAGCGDGYSVESQFVRKLPFVQYQRPFAEPDRFVVPDCAEGWGEAVVFGLTRWFDGHDAQFDYSALRPAGAPLKIKGGRASGPKPLRDLLLFLRKVVLSRQGMQLRPIDVNDMMTMTGTAGNSGGMRRAAKISLSDWLDEEMEHAKDGEFWRHSPWRENANNSAAWPDAGPSQIDLIRQMEGMMRSGSGERGIFSRANALRMMPSKRRDQLVASGHAERIGTNPCQPDFATVLTPDGVRTFADIDVGSTIWSGKRWTKVVKKWATGVKPVFCYQTTAGGFIGTADHRVISEGERVRADDAECIDTCQGEWFEGVNWIYADVMDGWVVGDGSVHKASGDLVHLCVGANDGDIHGELSSLVVEKRSGLSDYAWIVKTTITANELPMTYEREIPSRFRFGSPSKACSFLRGLYSANGSVVDGRVVLKAASFSVIQSVQEMLSAVGIPSYFTSNRGKVVSFANGDYQCRDSYDLNITRGRVAFATLIGFVQKYKTEKLHDICGSIGPSTKKPKISYGVSTKTYLGQFPVYDITVEDEDHTYWTGGLLVSNCGEVVLRDRGLCNLSIAVARPGDDLESLRRKVRAATILGTIQSLATHFPYISPAWSQNAREERLLGVDITGQMDCPAVRDAQVLAELKALVRETNRHYAQRFGINESAATTVNKPSGNSSALLDCAPGIHGRKIRYGIRNARVNAHSPVFKVLRACGVPMDPENGQNADTADTWVIHFPMKAPDGAIIAKEQTALEQLEHWKLNKLHWTEHNPSATIEYGPDEMIDVIGWVWAHREIIGGLSFLPKSNSVYRQMPYEETTCEEYERAAAAFPVIDWALIAAYETEDTTTSAKELACTAGGCETA